MNQTHSIFCIWLLWISVFLSRGEKVRESVCGVDRCVYAVRGQHSLTYFLEADLLQNQELNLVASKSLLFHLHKTPPNTGISGVHIHSAFGFFENFLWCVLIYVYVYRARMVFCLFVCFLIFMAFEIDSQCITQVGLYFFIKLLIHTFIMCYL